MPLPIISLLDFSDEVLLDLLDHYLDPISLARVGGTCRRLSSLAQTRSLWERRIDASFHGAIADIQGREASSNLFGTLLRPRTEGWKCLACNDTLDNNYNRKKKKSDDTKWPPDTSSQQPFAQPHPHSQHSQQQQQRCACVCRRVRLPLTVMGFTTRRCRSSSIENGKFSRMIHELTENFDLNLQLVDDLPNFMEHHVDLLILCTTEGPELTDLEHQRLIHFVREQGGTAIVSAFSNWSTYGHFNQKLSNWLGVTVIPHAQYLPQRIRTRIPRAPERPWGATIEVKKKKKKTPNRLLWSLFSSTRRLPPPDDDEGEDQGSRHMDVVNAIENLFTVAPIRESSTILPTTCAYFPRGDLRTGAGHVFVCSNYHWIADSDHWSGGLFEEGTNSNRRFLLNLAADAALWSANSSPSLFSSSSSSSSSRV